MIVVDTNVICYLYLSGDRSTQAVKLMRIDADWAVPRLWRSEMLNVLARYMRKDRLELSDARHIMDRAEALIGDREYEVTAREVLKLAQSSGCSAYDCEFVALAQRLNVPLVTVDKGILRRFPEHAAALEVYTTH